MVSGKLSAPNISFLKRRNKTMNKTELVAAVAEKAGMTKVQAAEAVNAVFESITDALSKGDKVAVVGFGNFEVRERAAHGGINPQTKEKVMISAKKAPAFKAGKALKDAVK